jgi:hypothetical protein
VVAEFQLPIDNNTCTENLVLEELIGQLQAFGFLLDVAEFHLHVKK